MILSFALFAVPLNLGDGDHSDPRLARILKAGEYLQSLHASGKACVRKLFPGSIEAVEDFTALPEILETMASKYEDRLRSAARGGAKTALGMVKAHYPEADIRMVSKYMPKYNEDGSELDQKAVLSSVSGFATRVATMVNLSTYYEAVEVPPRKPDEPPSSPEEENIADAQAEDGDQTT